jgi:ComF family protein
LADGASEGGGPCGRCLRQPPPWSSAITALDYAYPWDRLLAALKFRDGLDLLPWASHTLATAVRMQPLPAVDLLVPVPLATARLRERGYNQAWELARGVARELALTTRADLLERLIDTPHQIALPRDQRAANMRGAFGVTAAARTTLPGRRVALIDDVLTTGATLAEASRTLLTAGAVAVQVWVLARTP